MAGRTCADCTATYTVDATRCPHCGSTEWTDGPAGSVLPTVTVACSNSSCAHDGKQRRVHLRTAAPGVLEMPVLVCAGCGFAMSRVAPWPPLTGAEDIVPKITKLGGPSNRFADAPETAGAVNDTPAAAAPAPDEQQGGEQPSPGNSSSPSPASTQTSTEPSEKPRQRRARTTGSRSKKAQTAASSAHSTDGGRADATSAADKAAD